LRNVMILNSIPPKLEAAPIPTHTLPRSAETLATMIDNNKDGSTDDEIPLPMAASGQIHPIKFAEEIDPANLTKTRTMQGCADFLDLMLIKAYNGGEKRYCTFSSTGISDIEWRKGWKFNRTSTGYYTDYVIRRLDENHERGGSDE